MTINPPALFDSASRLLHGSRATEADLRRAVSTAYYAAFHTLSNEFASNFNQLVRPWASRVLEHRKAAHRAKALTSQKTLPNKQPCPTIIAEVANDFMFLQESREHADYDLDRTYPPSNAKYAVERAHRLVTNVRTARSKCPDDLQAFVLGIVVQSRAG